MCRLNYLKKDYSKFDFQTSGKNLYDSLTEVNPENGKNKALGNGLMQLVDFVPDLFTTTSTFSIQPPLYNLKLMALLDVLNYKSNKGFVTGITGEHKKIIKMYKEHNADMLFMEYIILYILVWCKVLVIRTNNNVCSLEIESDYLAPVDPPVDASHEVPVDTSEEKDNLTGQNNNLHICCQSKLNLSESISQPISDIIHLMIDNATTFLYL